MSETLQAFCPQCDQRFGPADRLMLDLPEYGFDGGVRCGGCGWRGTRAELVTRWEGAA